MVSARGPVSFVIANVLVLTVILSGCRDADPVTSVVPPRANLTLSAPVYLHGVDSTGGNVVLTADSIQPSATVARYQDTPAVNFSAGNSWRQADRWNAAPGTVSGSVSSAGDFTGWVGLKNSDDIGTRFDVRVELLKNGVVLAAGTTTCVTGVTSSANQAVQVHVAFPPFTPTNFDGATDTLSVVVSARVGTTASGTLCGGHSNATGLRWYFDAVSRPAGLVIEASSGSSAPPIPDSLFIPDDSTRTIVWAPGSEIVAYRRQFFVSFRSDATDAQRAAFFSTFAAVAVGGDPDLRGYVIQVPDPGTSVTAYLGLYDAIRTAPGVAAAVRLNREEYLPEPSSRFPADGAGYSRAAWRAGSDTVWHLNAIRAPEAWGCETGAYGGGSPVKIGFFELGFANDPDLPVPASRVVTLASLASASNPHPVPDSSYDWAQRHGRAVVAAAVARANNGIGVTGVMWNADVTVYRYFSTFRSASSTFYTLRRLRSELRSNPVDLLNISFELATKAPISEDDRRLTDSTFAEILADNPRLAIVRAVGNSASVYDPNALPDTTEVLTAAFVRLRVANPQLASRLISVASTTRSNRLAPASSWIVGQMAVGAPGDTVFALDGPSTDVTVAGVNSYAVISGSSFAAPLVTGTLGLLRAFASSLSPAEYFDYLVRGAQLPRRNPGTLAANIPSKVTSSRTGEQIVTIDAYGSLSLIGNERLGTPVCGVEAELADTALILRRGGGSVRDLALRLAPNEFFGDVSIAQGGRRLSAWVTDASFNDVLREYSLSNGNWTLTDSRPLNGRERFYAETDTIYAPFDGSTTYERHGADGSVESLDIASSGAYAGFVGSPFVTQKSVSPDGRWVFLRAVGSATCAGGGFAARTMLISLKPAAGPPVMLRDLCDAGPTAPGLGVWSASGKQLFGFGGAGRTLWTSTTAQGGWVEGNTVSLGSQVLDALPTPDDVGTLGVEVSGNACNHVLRAEQNPAVFLNLEISTQAACPTFTYPFIRLDSDQPVRTSDSALRTEYMAAARRRPQPAARSRRPY